MENQASKVVNIFVLISSTQTKKHLASIFQELSRITVTEFKFWLQILKTRISRFWYTKSFVHRKLNYFCEDRYKSPKWRLSANWFVWRPRLSLFFPIFLSSQHTHIQLLSEKTLFGQTHVLHANTTLILIALMDRNVVHLLIRWPQITIREKYWRPIV